MHRAIRIAALACCGLLTAARPAPLLQGAYRPDCAPYDGAAFVITLPAPAQKGEFRLQANAPLSQIARRWVHSSGNARPGTAMVMLCRTAPDLMCDYPEAGTFSVSGQPGTKIRGSFNARFVDGARYRYRFSAAPDPKDSSLRCG